MSISIPNTSRTLTILSGAASRVVPPGSECLLVISFIAPFDYTGINAAATCNPDKTRRFVPPKHIFGEIYDPVRLPAFALRPQGAGGNQGKGDRRADGAVEP